jgi:hypothetical protein
MTHAAARLFFTTRSYYVNETCALERLFREQLMQGLGLSIESTDEGRERVPRGKSHSRFLLKFQSPVHSTGQILVPNVRHDNLQSK